MLKENVCIYSFKYFLKYNSKKKIACDLCDEANFISFNFISSFNTVPMNSEISNPLCNAICVLSRWSNKTVTYLISDSFFL